MKNYEEPRLEIINLEEEDIITLSNGGTSSGPGGEFLPQNDWSDN